jgi:lauroyl/myristoyl acyltransferase
MIKTALIRALRLFASRRPRAGFALSVVLAWLTQPLGRGVPEERIRGLIPELDAPALRAARRRTWSNFLLGEALEAAFARTGTSDANPRIVASPALGRLRAPLILVTFHVGAFRALAAVLERLDGEVIAVHQGSFAPRRGITLVPSGDDEWERARTFARAARVLRAGGFVFTALDDYEAATLEAPLLDGSAPLARGAFALARIARVPIVPIVARWRGGSVEVECGDPIQPGDDEAAMAAAAASWLDSYLRAFPGELNAQMVRTLERR